MAEVIRRHVAGMPLHTPLAGLPPMLRLAGETASAIVAGASTGEYVADARLVLKEAVTRRSAPACIASSPGAQRRAPERPGARPAKNA